MGLLLAVNTMPRGDLQAVSDVHEAAGPAFFDRLLLPLHRSQVLPSGQQSGALQSAGFQSAHTQAMLGTAESTRVLSSSTQNYGPRGACVHFVTCSADE